MKRCAVVLVLALSTIAFASGCAASPAVTGSSNPISEQSTDETLEEAVETVEEEAPDVDSVCGSYWDAQIKASEAMSPVEIDPTTSTVIGGVTLPAADCAFQMTLGTGEVQIALGYNDADPAEFHNLLLAGGFTDIQVWEDPSGSGSSYISTHPSGTGATIWAGDRVVSGMSPRGIHIGYTN